jgi:hypothetical protein
MQNTSGKSSSTKTSSPAALSVSVRDFGAVGDGLHDDSPAIQAALSSLSHSQSKSRSQSNSRSQSRSQSGYPSNSIIIPSGTYLVHTTLRVPSHTAIYCEPDTKLLLAAHAAPSRDRFLLTNEHHEQGSSDIWIDGGIWDGNADGNVRGPDHPDSFTGVLIDFFNVEALRLSNMQLSNPDSYHIRLCRVRNFQIHNIVFRSTMIRPNQDGIHIAGNCSGGSISSISAVGPKTPNDDLIALNADDNNDRAQNLGLENGPIRDIVISRLRADDCHSFVRLLSTDSPIENIRITDVEGGFREHAVNMDAGRNCAVPVVPADDPRTREPLGRLYEVTLQDFRVYSTLKSGKPYINLETACDAFSLDRFTREVEKEVDAESATIEMNYLPACRLKLVGNLTVSSAAAPCQGVLQDKGSLSISCSLEKNTAFKAASGSIDSLQILQQ